MERELNEQEINLERENIVVGGMPIENFYTKTEVDELLETKADNNDIPTLTSELTNDSGFIISETDPIFSNSVAHNITSNDITSWNNKSNFSGSYNDLNDKPTIPTNLSELNEDTTHRTVSDTEKSSWNNKSDFSGSYTDLTDKPTIPTVPTNISSFTNDSGYLVSGDLKTINGNSVVGSGDITISGENTGLRTLVYEDSDVIAIENLEKGIYILKNQSGALHNTIKMRRTATGQGYVQFRNIVDGLIKISEDPKTYDTTGIPFIYCVELEDGTLMRASLYYTGQTFMGGVNVTRGNVEYLLTTNDSQTITGKKTFNTLPETSIVPTENNQLVNKSYVDSAITSAITTTLNGSY